LYHGSVNRRGTVLRKLLVLRKSFLTRTMHAIVASIVNIGRQYPATRRSR